MVPKINWNNYIYSCHKWEDYLNKAYPLDDYKIKVRLSGHACERIIIEAGEQKNLRSLNHLEFNDYFWNKNNNLHDIADTILDKSKLDYKSLKPIKCTTYATQTQIRNSDFKWHRYIYIKGTQEWVAYETYGVQKKHQECCMLLLSKHSVPYIVDPQLIVFAQEDLKVRVLPLKEKQKELNQNNKKTQKLIDRYKKLIITHQASQKDIETELEDIKYQLSNKPPR